MSNDLNMVQVIGRLGKDPEVRRMNNGNSVANFSVASSETWRDKQSGERKEKTEWFNVVVWGDGLIKVVESYIKKGSRVYVQGKLQTRKWQDQSGSDKYTTEVVLQGFDSKLIMLDSKPAEQPARQVSSHGGGGYELPAGRHVDMGDEIPFMCEWR